MHFRVELEREDDGRWIGEVPDLPGVLAYGKTREEALAAVEALALRILRDRARRKPYLELSAGIARQLGVEGIPTSRSSLPSKPLRSVAADR